MEITRRENKNIVILDINGEIDLYNAPEIKDIIAKLIEEKRYQITAQKSPFSLQVSGLIEEKFCKNRM